MSLGQGYKTRCGVLDESTYGTAVAVSELMPYTSEAIEKMVNKIESAYLNGKAGREALKSGVIQSLGDLSGNISLNYQNAGGFEYIVWAFAGGAGSRDAGNSLNQYKVAEAVDNSFTLAFNKDVSVWELPGCKVNTLEISGEAGEESKINWTAGIIAQNLLRTGDAGITNDSAQLTGISTTGAPSMVTFEDMVFRIGDTSNALAGGDQLKIKAFTLNCNNNLSDPTFSTVDSNHTNNLLTLEPKRNGFREIALQVTIPRYDSDSVFTWMNNHTALQCDLKFSVGSYEFNILLPYCYVNAAAAPIPGPELVEHTFEIIPVRLNAIHAYMTYQDSDVISDEIGFELKTGRSNPVDV